MANDDPAANLRAWLLASGTSQTELARRLDVTVAAVGHWLAGRARPDLDRAAALEHITLRAVRAIDWAKEIDARPE